MYPQGVKPRSGRELSFVLLTKLEIFINFVLLSFGFHFFHFSVSSSHSVGLVGMLRCC